MKKLLWLILCGAFFVLTGTEAGKPQPKIQAAKWYFRTAVPAGPLECNLRLPIRQRRECFWCLSAFCASKRFFR